MTETPAMEPVAEEQTVIDWYSIGYREGLKDWADLTAENKRLAADLASERAKVKKAIEALQAAYFFTHNGIALGFIRMPDEETPDPAHRTPPLIEETLAALRASTVPEGGEL